MNPMAPSVDMLRGAPSLTPLSGADESRIRQTAQQFEATFMAQMLRPMFEGLSTEAPFGGGPPAETRGGGSAWPTRR